MLSSDPGSGFELLPQPVIPRASTVIRTDNFIFIVASPKKRVSFSVKHRPIIHQDHRDGPCS